MSKIISGIYVIINISNNKIYVGSSVNIKKRINRHFNELRKNRHCNKDLQNSWNKNGEKMFINEVLEEVENHNELVKREQYYIDMKNASKLTFGYNLCSKAYNSLGYRHTKETKEKMSEERKINSTKYAKYGKDHWRWGLKTPNNIYNPFRDNHPDYNGEKSPRAKLTNEIVLNIRKEYKENNYTYRKLGKMFNVKEKNIGRIIKRERWKNI